MTARLRIGLLASVGQTLDAFFPEIVRQWRGSGCEVFPAAGTVSHSLDSTVIRGVTREPRISNLRGAFGLRRWIRDADLDVVITNTASASALVRIAEHRVPIVYFCHGLHWSDPDDTRSVHWQATERLLLRNTAGVVTINSDDEAWFRRRGGDRPLLRLEYGVGLDPERFGRTPPPDPRSPLRLCWIGELTPRKRPQDVIEIAAGLLDRGVDFRIEMLGEGGLRNQVEEEIQRRGLGSHIAMRGRVPVLDYLNKSQALIHTAEWEGLPRVMLEALAVGRRIFSYDIKGARDLPNCTLLPRHDTEAYANELARFAARGSLQKADLPPSEELSSALAAGRILQFTSEVTRRC